MPSGDTLTVIGLAITAMIGALTVTGGRATFLWVLTIVFLLVAVGYAGLFSKLGLDLPATSQWVTALIAPVTVTAVALMFKDRASHPPHDDPADHSDALRQVSNAISNADWHHYDVPAASAKASQAVLESAFVTVRKKYKISTPELGEPNADSLKLGVAFLRSIQPFLRAGHLEEAGNAAADFRFP